MQPWDSLCCKTKFWFLKFEKVFFFQFEKFLQLQKVINNSTKTRNFFQVELLTTSYSAMI